MNLKFSITALAQKMNIRIFVRSFLIASLFAIATFPVTGIAATSETGYDNYLLFTQELGKTIAGGITEGAEKTSLLYKSAWSELTSFSGFSVKFPAVTIPSLRGGALSSYTQFSQNLGEAYADNFINYVSGTEAIGDAIAGGIKDGFAGSANLYTQSLAKSKSLVTNTTTDTTQSLASIGSTLDSISTSISTFWKNLFPSPSPTPTQPTTKVVTPKTVTPTIVTPPKPPVTTTIPTPVPKPTTTVTPATSITTGIEIPSPQPIVQNIILPTTSSSELITKIEQLRNELLAKIGTLSSRDDAHYQGNFQAIALTNKIDQLTNTVITNPTITGASITGGSISGATISGSITGSSGSFTGNLTVSGTATSTFAGDSAFDTDTLYVDSLNDRVGIATSSPSDTFALNGAAYLAQISAPSVTVNRLYNESGNLTWNGTVIGGASTGQWTLSGSDVYRSSGNVGIGTTSPYAKLSVAGEVVASHFTATSTTATTTLQGTILAASGGNVGVGTTTPNMAKLSVGGTLLASGHAAFGNESSINATDWYLGTANNVLSVKENRSGSGSLPITGIYTEATRTPDSAIVSGGTVIGISAIGKLEGTPAIWSGDIYGGSLIGVNNSSYPVQNVYGVYGEVSVWGTGGITNAFGGRFGITDGGGGGVITNAYGVSVGNIAVSGTNTYGVHVAAQTSGGASSYAFYSAGASDKSYFAGKVGIGTTTMNNKLDIYSTSKSAIGFSGASGDNYKWTIGMDVTNGGRFSIASSTALGTLDRFVIDGAGNVGIGTTSPYAKLSVVGEVVGSYFTSTSTSATSTFANHISIGSGKEYRINGAPVLSGSASGGLIGFGNTNSASGIAVGINNTNSGAAAVAVGYSNQATSTLSTALGSSNNSGGVNSIAIGNSNYAYALGSVAIGTGVTNNTASSLMIGPSDSAKLTILSTGNLGIGTTSPYAKLSVVGEVVASHFTATSTSATTTISGGLNVGNGAILYDYSSGVASVGNLELGSLNFDTNAGTVSWMDMPVTSSATAGTVESYTAQIDGTALITAYSQSDGAGNIKLSAVGIGTTTPSARLTVTTATSTENIPLFTVASSTGATLFTILNSGYVGIGTTTSAVNNTLVVQGGVCITGGTTCPAVSSGSLSLDTAGADGGNPGVFDIAERYPASETMEAGDIASLDGTTDDAAVVHKGVAGETLIGIVSTKAAVGINGSTLVLAPDQEATSTKPLIALAGRVPVKVTMEGGVIKKGDRITASSIPGVGKRATSTSEQTVGIALEKKETDGTVLVFVQTSPTRLDPAVADGTILDGNGESSFWSVEEGSGRIKFISQGIDLNDQDIVSVRAITGSAGKWSIDASGRLVVNEIQTNKLCVGETCVTENQFKEVFGNSQTAAVSTTPPPTEEETTAPSSTPPVAEDEPANEEPPEEQAEEPVVEEPTAEEETVEPEPEPAPEPAPEETIPEVSEQPAEEITEEETPVATSTPA